MQHAAGDSAESLDFRPGERRRMTCIPERMPCVRRQTRIKTEARKAREVQQWNIAHPIRGVTRIESC
jgi:hypothetical protein